MTKTTKCHVHLTRTDQRGHPPSLIRVFAVRSMDSQGLMVSSYGQRSLWSDWVDAQADLSLRWAHMSVCWFCHTAAHLDRNGLLKGIWKSITKKLLMSVQRLYRHTISFNMKTMYTNIRWITRVTNAMQSALGNSRYRSLSNVKHVTNHILRGSKNLTLVFKIVLFKTLRIHWIPIIKIDTSNMSFTNLINLRWGARPGTVTPIPLVENASFMLLQPNPTAITVTCKNIPSPKLIQKQEVS